MEKKYDAERLSKISEARPIYSTLGLKYNPFFESGLAPDKPVFEPLQPLGDQLWSFLEDFIRSRQYHGAVLLGGWGTGKTYHLKWVRETLDSAQLSLKVVYVSSPGYEPYHLIREIISSIGRSEMITLLWSLILPQIREGYNKQGTQFITENFWGPTVLGRKEIQPRGGLFLQNPTYMQEDALADQRRFIDEYDKGLLPRQKLRDYAARIFLESREAKLTDDPDLAGELASLAVFDEHEAERSWKALTVPGRGKTIFSPEAEADFLRSLFVLLQKAGYEYLVLLIDEFEGLLLGGRITKTQANYYLWALRQMIDASWQTFPLAFITASTPEIWDRVKGQLYPPLEDRLRTGLYELREFTLPVIDDERAANIVAGHMALVRIKTNGRLFPFQDDFLNHVPKNLRDTPRKLIRMCHALVEEAVKLGKHQIDNQMVQSFINESWSRPVGRRTE
jgi:hypothetical protein